MDTEILIDGSQGEGGGQIIRSSLSLSLLTGRSFTIDNIRAKRKTPGLALQHLTAVRAAARVGNAEIEGDELGSRKISFRPNEFVGGHFEFPIATAGSAILVLQTVLPGLMLAQGNSKVNVSGGTHNQMAPPYDFLAESYLPLVRKLGPSIDVKLYRYGFFPAGGGSIQMEIEPVETLKPIRLMERGKLISRNFTAIVSGLPRSIAKREVETFQSLSTWPKKSFEIVEIADPIGPGNVVLVRLEFENVTEIVSSFGQRGVPAEKVAKRAWNATKSYLKTEAPVGEYLADQLLLPMGIGAHLGYGGGEILTGPLSGHSNTHLDILHTFLDIQSSVTESDEGTLVSILPVSA